MSVINIYQLGTVYYRHVFEQQRSFTDGRTTDTADEIWCLQHPAVYTLGLSGNKEHILVNNNIPVFHSDRGGQVTYHGPGQLVMYLLIDLKRLGIPVRKYVYSLEQAIIRMLSTLSVQAARKKGAPGVYVNKKKLAALGVRIRRGCCYHGISMNIDMDLSPFDGINPCGYPGLEVTQLADLGQTLSVDEAGLKLLPFIAEVLGVKNFSIQKHPLEFEKKELLISNVTTVPYV